jgi:hypothetical protein
MAAQLGIDHAAESKSCTICHAPMRQVSPSMFADPAPKDEDLTSVSCANCHGGAEKWLLSHTRPDYPTDALARLGMRQLGSSYQRANNCVACHQNLNDDLVGAKHPPLIFELDGLLVAEPKHWREKEGFSHAQTWLVGQAVALREAAAQALREPGERRRAEIEAIKGLLKATGTRWDESPQDLVRAADDYAKRISATTMGIEQSRAILIKLLENREPFQAGAFGAISEEYRMWAKGYYAERLVLAIDRLNDSLVISGRERTIANTLLNDLFDAAKPPKGFDAAAADTFVRKLDLVAESYRSAP